MLLVLAAVSGLARREGAPPIATADHALAEMDPLPRATAAPPSLADLPPATAAARADDEYAVRWRPRVEAAGGEWQALSQPLPPETLSILRHSDAPGGMAFRYGIAQANAGRLQDVLGIRDVVSRNAARSSAERRAALAADLRGQAACLAGVDLGAVYPPSMLTPQRVAGLLDLGLVRGERDRRLDERMLRGITSGNPADCRVFDTR